MQRQPRQFFMNMIHRKAHRHITKQPIVVPSEKHESSTKSTKGYCITSADYDWETLDDLETCTKCRAWEVLSNALNSKEPSLSSISASVSKIFHTDCILHEAIEHGVPDHVLMQLVDRFPTFLTELDRDGRYPLHVACALQHCRESSSVASSRTAHASCKVGWLTSIGLR